MRSPKIISNVISKGGTGKSTILGNVGYSLSKKKKILFIDSDPQRNLTNSYGVEAEKEKNLYYGLKKMDLGGVITETPYENISMIAADANLMTIEKALDFDRNDRYLMRDLLKNLGENFDYDYILIDTNPNMNSFNLSLLRTIDFNLLPVEPGPFCMEGLALFINLFNLIKEDEKTLRDKSFKDLAGIVINKADKRKSILKDISGILQETFPEILLKSIISVDSNIEKSQLYSMPLEVYNKNSRAVKDFNKLAKEVEKIVKK